MVRAKKRSCRELADFISDFGVIPGELDYETYIGLIANSDRSAMRKVYYATLAHTIASSDKEVPKSVVNSVCTTKTMAEDLALKINSARERSAKGWE